MRKPPKHKIMTDELEHEIIELYNSGLPAPKILDQIGKFKTTKTIYDVLYKHGVLARTGDTMRDPNLNHAYFENIDTYDKAYALGLMISDGWVARPQYSSPGHIIKNPQIALSLNIDDQYLVEWMKAQWNSSNAINLISNNNATVFPGGKTYECKDMSRIVVTSQKMYMDLDKLGVDINKSYLSCLPKINLELYSHLLRGILDGDGTVGIYPYGDKETLSVKFTGTQCLVGQISWLLSELLDVDYVKPSGKKNAVLSSVTYNIDSQTKILTDYLYKNKDQSMYLKRKYKIVEDYFS